MLRIYKELRTSHEENGDICQIRIGVECVLQYTEHFLESRTSAAFLSILMTVAVYRYCAVLAYIERGGKTAYGGEYLAALVSGLFTYYLIRQFFGKGKEED